MAIDTSIYGMIQTPKVPTPFENVSQAMTIKNLIEQDRMRPQMQQLAMQKAQSALAHEQAQTGKHVADARTANLKIARDSLAGVSTDEDLMRHGELVKQLFGPDAAAGMPQTVKDPNFETMRTQKIMSADEMLKRVNPELKTRDLGGTVDTYNPYTGKSVETQAKTISPDQAAKQATAKTRKGTLPVQALKLQQEELEGIGLGATISADLAEIRKKLDGGSLELGPVENLISKTKNWSGNSDENSRNFATFQSTLEKLRNDSLRLNKGVQTEGDAQRAWNEILANINDIPLVKQRLDEVVKINERAVNLRKMNVDNIRENYGSDPLDTTSYTAQPSALAPAKTETSAKTFSSMPDPSQYNGKRMKGDDGTIYKSDGNRWVRQ